MVRPGLALHPGHQEEECERHRQGPLEEVRQELLHPVGGSEVRDTGLLVGVLPTYLLLNDARLVIG